MAWVHSPLFKQKTHHGNEWFILKSTKARTRSDFAYTQWLGVLSRRDSGEGSLETMFGDDDLVAPPTFHLRRTSAKRVQVISLGSEEKDDSGRLKS